MEYFKVRNEAGDEQEVDIKKVLQAEKDGYLPIVSNAEGVEHRVSTQDFSKAKKDGYNPIKTSDVGGIEAGLRGAVRSITWGAGDEIGGGLEALGSMVGVRGLGSPYLKDVRLETDEEDKQDLSEIYSKMRDRRRDLHKETEKAQPGAYLAGQVGGGLATALIPGGALLQATKGATTGAKILAGAAAGGVGGGIVGAGESEAELIGKDKEIGRFATDVAKGAGIGAVAGGGLAGGGVLAKKGFDKTMDIVSDVTQPIKTRVEGFKRGFRQSIEESKKDPGILDGKQLGQVTKVLRATKESLQETKGALRTKKELSDLAQEAKDILLRKTKGSDMKEALEAKMQIDDLTDEEALIISLMDDEPNAIKEWVADKAATTLPGDIKKEDYLNVLDLGAGRRVKGREFLPKEGAKGLSETMKDVKESFESARGMRFAQLQDEASRAYNPKDTQNALNSVRNALRESADIKSVGGKVTNALEDAKQIIEEGIGFTDQGLTKGGIEGASAGEHYLRLQRARETLDDAIEWGEVNSGKNVQAMLKRVRSEVDGSLKTVPSKLQADELFSTSKRIQDQFFKVTEFSKNGWSEIDEFKLAKLLNDTDQAGRFKNALVEFKEFIKRPDLSEDFRLRGGQFISELDETMKTMEAKRAVGRFRFKQGPTSPAVERAQAVLGKNTPLESAIMSPSGFVNQMDENLKSVASKIGKQVGDLTDQDKLQAAKIMKWKTQNPMASNKETDRYFEMAFPQIERQKAIDEFKK